VRRAVSRRHFQAAASRVLAAGTGFRARHCAHAEARECFGVPVAEPIALDMSELIKVGGSVRCRTPELGVEVDR